MKQQVGFRYIDCIGNEQMVWGFAHWKDGDFYVVNDPNKDDDRVHGELVTEERMDHIIANQEAYRLKKIKNEEYKENFRKKEEEEKERQREKENLFGFDSNLTPLRRGKVLQTLMKEINYRDVEGKVVYGATKKEFILYLLSVGFVPTEYTEQKEREVLCQQGYFRSNIEIEKYTKHSFIMKLQINENRFDSYKITKTEYEFAKYIENLSILKTN